MSGSRERFPRDHIVTSTEDFYQPRTDVGQSNVGSRTYGLPDYSEDRASDVHQRGRRGSRVHFSDSNLAVNNSTRVTGTQSTPLLGFNDRLNGDQFSSMRDDFTVSGNLQGTQTSSTNNTNLQTSLGNFTSSTSTSNNFQGTHSYVPNSDNFNQPLPSSTYSFQNMPTILNNNNNSGTQSVIPNVGNFTQVSPLASFQVPPGNLPSKYIAVPYIFPQSSSSCCSRGNGIDVSRWNVKYSGEGSVEDFLERVEELRIARGASKEQLFSAVPDLVTNDALRFFRTRQFADWDDFANQLRLMYQRSDEDRWEEIRHRTQGSEEKVLSFILAIESMFRKLSSLPSEETRFAIIRRNLLPYIQSHLAIQQIKSIEDLLTLSRQVEDTEVRLQRFAPPPTNYKYLVDPDLAYHKPSRTTVASVQESSSGHDSSNIAVAAVQPGSSGSSSVVCWNCRETGHRFRKCSKPRRRFCFKCGRDNVLLAQCGCSKNLSTEGR
uniref:Uncharacterized protein LOC114334923 n=1 Tax=Diabrotica virgifera virgifera TaxID=50390 RepID=A0A6P7G1F3_DIAVI